MHKDTFKHGHLYRITLFGKLDLSKGKFALLRSPGSTGEPVWFVGLVWKKRHPDLDLRTRFFLVASNYQQNTRQICIEHNETLIDKVQRVKVIEPFTRKELPLLVGTRTTTLYECLLKYDKKEILQFLVDSRNREFLSEFI